MRQVLTLHPDSRCTAVDDIGVEAARPRPGRLVLRYAVTGRPDDLCLPPVTTPARSVGLWQHTCFEAFVRASSGGAYYEFNFAPSRQWAAYGFGGYRQEMNVAGGVAAPRIEEQFTGEGYVLQATLEMDRLPDLPRDAAWSLGIAAVIEETGGGLSYWALAHPPGPADFHHPDGFVLDLLAAAEQP